MRPRSTLLLLLLLTAPLAGATTDPGARDLIEPSGGVDVTAALLARENGHIVYGTTDPGDNVPSVPPGGPGANEQVWFVLDPMGEQDLEFGTADRPECSGPGSAIGSGDDCSTDVALLDTNDLGTRQVVAGISELGLVLRFHPNVGEPIWRVIEESMEVAYLDMDAEGTAVAVAYRSGVDAWEVMAYRWPGEDGGAFTPWTEPDRLPARPTGLSMGGDGKFFAVSAGETYIRYTVDGAGTKKDNQFPGTGQSVAMARDAGHTTVMGTSAGRLTLHNDTRTVNDQLLNFKRADSPITTVAITDDASIIAWGNEAGTFGMGLFQGGIFQVLGEFDVEGEPDDIALDGTGETAAVLVGDTVHLFGRSGSDVFHLWEDTPLPDAAASNLGTISIRNNGETILVPRGDGVLLYDAIHDVQVTGDTPTLTPGTEGALTLRITNDGNRLATTELKPTAPQGWTVTPAVGEVVVAPDETVQVLVAVTPAASAEPGTATLTFRTNINGTDVAHEVDLNLERVVDWAIGLRENASETLSVDAGQPGVFKLYVENRGNTPRAAPLRLTVSDPDWSAAFTSGDGTVQPGARADLDVRVTPPAGALQLEEATITVRLDGFGDPVALRAVVGAVFGVELDAPAGIEVEDGRSRTFNVTVRNTGNTEDSVRLTFGDLPVGWQGRFSFGLTDISAKNIPAGDTRVVPVTIEVPVGAQSEAPYLVPLRAASFGDATNVVVEEIFVTVVEPAPPKDPDNRGPGLPLIGLLAAVGAAFLVRRRC